MFFGIRRIYGLTRGKLRIVETPNVGKYYFSVQNQCGSLFCDRAGVKMK